MSKHGNSRLFCRRPESNRHGYHYPRDFKSRASTSSATAARYEHLATVFWSLTCDAYRTLSESRPQVADELSSPVMTRDESSVVAPSAPLEQTKTSICSTKLEKTSLSGRAGFTLGSWKTSPSAGVF